MKNAIHEAMLKNIFDQYFNFVGLDSLDIICYSLFVVSALTVAYFVGFYVGKYKKNLDM